MQTILGSGGAIGTPLARELKKFTSSVRLFSRNPKQVNGDDELISGSLLNAEDVNNAVKGSEAVYLTAGLEYKSSAWEAQWPVVMRNVIDACAAHNAKLVFFDNIYSIGKEHLNPITEELPISPCSRKGRVRAELVQMLREAMDSGRIQAIIARSPDFYGPAIQTSMLMQTVYLNLMKNKAPQWLGRGDKKHSFIYTSDAAAGTALLGNAEDTWNQIWNLPTHTSAPTGEEWSVLLEKELKKPHKKLQSMPQWMVSVLGIFIPILRELGEMTYQFDRDYVFDSSKFCKRFGYTPVSPEEGIRLTVAELQQSA